MKKNKIILFAVLFFNPLWALASLSDVCGIKVDSIKNSSISQDAIQSYKKRLEQECNLSKRYLSLRSKLQNEFQIKLTDITEYQALRFVQRSWFDKAVQSKKPIEKTYQIWKNQYLLPIDQQSADVWDDWALGIQQIKPVINDINEGGSFDLNQLKKIHKGLFPFYPMINEHGEFAHEPNPGVLKPTTTTEFENYWWSVTDPTEIEKSKVVVEKINSEYEALGLVTSTPKGVNDFVKKIIDIRLAPNRRNPQENVMAIFSGHSMVNRQNLELILNFIDQNLKQARAQQPMIWNNRIFTPAELAYFVQQIYVRIHPFYEGNGRTSRFLQELILAAFNLPEGASGDLMDIDALTIGAEYYQTAIDKNNQLFDKVESCINEYKKYSGQNLKQISSENFSYSCQILADRSQIWEALKIKNNADQVNLFKEETRLKDLDLTTENQHKAIIQSRK